jgi:acetoin utilization protein AcuB
MALHKYGSAVIVRGSQVLGIFTTTDALRALGTVLGGKQPRARKAVKPVARTAKRKTPARRSVAQVRKGSGQVSRRSPR